MEYNGDTTSYRTIFQGLPLLTCKSNWSLSARHKNGMLMPLHVHVFIVVHQNVICITVSSSGSIVDKMYICTKVNRSEPVWRRSYVENMIFREIKVYRCACNYSCMCIAWPLISEGTSFVWWLQCHDKFNKKNISFFEKLAPPQTKL